MRSLLLLVLLATPCLVAAPSAHAGPSTPSVDATHRSLQALADDPAARSRLDARLAALIDGDAMARAATGDTPVTDAQRRRLAGALARIARVRYRAALLARRGGAGGPVQTRPGPGGSTRLLLPIGGGPPLEVAYKVGEGRMRAFDVITDSVSLAKNYKYEINRLNAPPRPRPTPAPAPTPTPTPAPAPAPPASPIPVEAWIAAVEADAAAAEARPDPPPPAD